MTTTRRRILPLLLAAMVASLLALAPWASSARADTTTSPDVSAKTIASELQSKPLYVASGTDILSSQGQQQVRQAINNAHTSIYVAVVPAMTSQQASRLGNKIARDLNLGGTLAVLTDNKQFVAGSSVVDAGALADRATQNHQGDPAGGIVAFVNNVDSVASGGEPTSTGGGGGGAPVALIVLLLIVAGGVCLYGVSRYRRHQREQEQLEQVRHAAQEDVTVLGEDVASLDLDVRQPDLADATREDYERALDAYDTAKRRLSGARKPEDLRGVSEALENGRYAMTCVRARLDGKPVPERRAPCFFNPQHGPSVMDTDWAPEGGSNREVPVCAACATRLNHGQDPETREVLVGGVRRPYWEGGPAYAPWFGGYYGGFGMGGMLPGFLMGTMLGSALTPGFGMGGFGGGDFGGGDFGGGDFGGGDFGGFGGGDFGGFGGGDF
ncbi:MAG: chemotaxis protein CheA [Streptosporangiaceae bacterium]